MKVYLVSELNERFTNLVNEYLTKGYKFNPGTMSGSQGELAKVDLASPDMKSVIRILMENERSGMEKYPYTYGMAISIKEFKSVRRSYINTFNSFNILWNSEGTLIYREFYFELNHYSSDNSAFCDEEMYQVAIKKHHERLATKQYFDQNEVTVSNVAAKRIVLPWVKKQYKCKGCKLSDISEIKKVIGTTKSYFKIKVKDKYLCLGLTG